ncbi:MAG TPA: hypothetical protein VK125_08935 [Bacillota bacterium]|nr:hypothetical protein [Bacillota bacterium]
MAVPYLSIKKLPRAYNKSVKGDKGFSDLAFISPTFIIHNKSYYGITISTRFKSILKKFLIIKEDGTNVTDHKIADELFPMIGLLSYIYDSRGLLNLYKEERNIAEVNIKLEHFNRILELENLTKDEKQAIRALITHVEQQLRIYKQLQQAAESAFQMTDSFQSLTTESVIDEKRVEKTIEAFQPSRTLMHKLLIHKLDLDDQVLSTLNNCSEDTLNFRHIDKTFGERLALEGSKDDVINNTLNFLQASNQWGKTNYPETKEQVVKYLQTTNYITDFIRATGNQFRHKYWIHNEPNK